MTITVLLPRVARLLGTALLAVGAVLALSDTAFPVDTTPLMINFQGRLTDASGNPITGNRDIYFRYYDASTAGTLLYAETYTAAGTNPVTVTQGNYVVALGGGSYTAAGGPLYTTFKAVFQNQTVVWLELQVVGEAVMAPRVRILGAGYAINADLFDGLEGSQFVLKTGDTLTGALTLPANGLTAGTDQLVLSGGKVGVGTTAPVATLDVGGTGAMKIPVGTTAQRPASPAAGMLRYNSGTGSLEFFDGTSWMVTVVKTPPPVASGGTESTISDGGVSYKVHRFNAGGTFTVTTAGYVEVLVVAGGGSGGNHNTTNGNGGGG
ncbi:MAG: hypothetical protein HY719_08995, partial [Planctomycetes bacterium]|nr:hypothetical protein [Planctomycetota bacterium]